MSLHVSVQGDGPDLVMLHGWGLHGGLFEQVAGRIARTRRVHRVDLPGHGASEDAIEPTLEAWTDAVVRAVPDGADWFGWSLGGTLALYAAGAGSAKVARVVAVAASPRFTRAPDWPHGIEQDRLDAVASGLEDDHERTVMRFLALQVHGDARARELLRALRREAFVHARPSVHALRAGLGILSATDLRGSLGGIRAPVLAIGGRRDRLVHPAAVEHLAGAVADGRGEVFDDSAHAPFLSEPARFIERVEGFLGRA